MGAYVIPAAMLAVTVGSSIYQGLSASEARDKAAAAEEQRRKDQEKLIADQKEQNQKMQDEQDQQTANAAAQVEGKSAKTRQRTLAAGGQGRSDTILTSPLGVIQYNKAPAKTVLGA